MRASSDTRSRDKALMGAIAAWGMTAEGSQERSQPWVAPAPQEQHRLRSSLQMCRSDLHSQETGAGEAGEEMSQRKATVETTTLLVFFQK